jgi:hypothetical protein
MIAPRASTETIIKALRILARDTVSDDGIANAAITEAADRLDELSRPAPGGVSPAVAPFSRAQILGWIGDNYTLEEIHAYFASRKK